MQGFGTEVAPTLAALEQFVIHLDEAARGDHLVFDGDLDLTGTLDVLGTGGEARAGRPLPPGVTGPPDTLPPAGGAP